MFDFLADQLLPNLLWLLFACVILITALDATMPWGKKDKEKDKGKR